MRKAQEIDPRLAAVDAEVEQRKAEEAATRERLMGIRAVIYPPALSSVSRPRNVTKREILEASLQEEDAEQKFKLATLALEDAVMRRKQIHDDIRRERLQEVRPTVLDALRRFNAKADELAAEHRRFVEVLRVANSAVGLGPSPIGAADVYAFTTDPAEVHFGEVCLLFDVVAESAYQTNRLEVWRAALRRDGWLQ